MKELSSLSIEEIKELYTTGELKISDYVLFCKNQSLKYKDLNAIITSLYDRVEDEIEISQKMYDQGTPRALEGIPVLLKDNFLTKDILTTCGSKMLSNFVPGEDAHVVKILKDAGAIIVGKVTMEEFAMGSLGYNTHHEVPLNPWTTNTGEKTLPGGSSSGSAISVTTFMAPIALGSDTGGSVRVPSFYCGILGYKPTYGIISRYGVVPLSSSLDTVGIFGRKIKDIFSTLKVLSSYDKRDASSIPWTPMKEYDFSKTNKKVCIFKEANNKPMIPEIKATIEKTKKFLEDQGFIVEEVSFPLLDYCLSLYYNIVPIEAMSNLAKFDGIKYGVTSESANNINDLYFDVRSNNFGNQVRRRICVGAYMASSHFNKDKYKQICAVKHKVVTECQKIFQEYDFILMPTATSHAELLDNYLNNKISATDEYNKDILTTFCNIAGIPGISIPTELSTNKLPIGITIATKPLHDNWLFELGAKIEEYFNFNDILLQNIK